MIGSSSSVVNGPPGISPFSSEQSFSSSENLVSTRHRNASSNESWSIREIIYIFVIYSECLCNSRRVVIDILHCRREFPDRCERFFSSVVLLTSRKV